MSLYFRILAGSHAEAEYTPILGPDNRPLLDADGYPRKHRNIIVYRRDDVVETEIDLARKFNPPASSGMSSKFERMTKEHAESYLRNRREAQAATIGDTQSSNPQLAALQQQMAMIQQQISAMLGQAALPSTSAPFNAGAPSGPLDKAPPGDPNSVSPDHIVTQGAFQHPKTAAPPSSPTGAAKNAPQAVQQHSGMPSPLDEMSLKELQEFAKSEEIDLKGVKQTKEEVVRAIRATGLV